MHAPPLRRRVEYVLRCVAPDGALTATENVTVVVTPQSGVDEWAHPAQQGVRALAVATGPCVYRFGTIMTRWILSRADDPPPLGRSRQASRTRGSSLHAC